MELVGEGGGWSFWESGVGTKVRLDVGLNSRGEVLSLTDSKLLIQGTQGIAVELVGEGRGWSLGESGVGTKVRLEVELNSRGEVLSLTDCKQGTQGVTERTSLNWLFGVSWMLLMLSSCVWRCSDSISEEVIGSSM